MATLTSVISLRKPDGTDYVSRVLDLNNNWDLIDGLFNATTGHKHSGTGTNGPTVTINESQVIYDAVEAATLDTLSGTSMLINNLNRIRYWLTQISGQALGTVGTSLNAHVQTSPAIHGGSSANYVKLYGAALGSPIIIASDGADANVGMVYSSRGNGAHYFYGWGNTAGQANLVMQVIPVTNGVNSIQVVGAVTGSGPNIAAVGSDANVDLGLQSKGTGGIWLKSGAGTKNLASFLDTPSAVNWLQFIPSATGANVSVSAVGSDATIGLILNGKGVNSSVYFQTQNTDYMYVQGGTGSISLAASGGSANVQLNLAGKGPNGYVNIATSGTNYIQVQPNATGNPPWVAAAGSDTNIGLTLASKGSGSVNLRTGNGIGLTVVDVISSVNYIQISSATTTNGPTILTAGSDANAPINVSSKGTGNVQLQTGAGTRTVAQFIDVASAVNYFSFQGSATGNQIGVGAVGSDANVGLAISSKGTGTVSIASGGFGRVIANFLDAASSVNYFQIVPAATGVSPYIAVVGSDVNISFSYATKGTGVHYFNTGGGTQFQVADTASAVNRVQIQGGATGNAVTVAAVGSDANVGLTLNTKGNGDIALVTAAGRFVSLGVTGNYIQVQANGGSTGPQITVTGAGADIDLNIAPKGTGGIINTGAYIAIGTNPATGGAIRLPSNNAINSRNSTNTGNVNLIYLDALDNLTLGQGGLATVILGPSLAIGTTPATSGVIRIPNNQQILSRNAANTGNRSLIQLSNADVVLIDSDATGAAFNGTVTHNKQYWAANNNLSGITGATTVDWNNSNVQLATLNGNVTFTFSNPQAGARYMLVLLQDATGGRTVTWPANVKWAGGTAPTLSGANKYDVIGFVYAFGNYYGSAGLNY